MCAGACFENADLRGADLREADLRGALLTGARVDWDSLQTATFHPNDLQGVVLYGEIPDVDPEPGRDGIRVDAKLAKKLTR